MQFNDKTLTISISGFGKGVLKELDKVRPKNVSFSMFLAIAAKHYIDTYREPVDIEGDLPSINSNISSWKSKLKNMSPKEFIKLQQRHAQLGNLIKTRARLRI